MRLLYMLPIAPSGTHRATLEACRQLPTRRAQRRECGWGPRLQGAQWACRSRYTQFSGGFALDFASAPRRGRCAELIVRPEGKGAPRREPLFEPRRHTCGGAARLSHEPAAITNACAQAAARARFAVLCPRRWPPPRGRGAPTTRVFEEAAETYLIDVDNGFSRRGAYVFHALVGGQLRPFGRW